MKIKDALNYFKANYTEYEVRKTGYTMQVITQDKKYFFYSELMNKKTFIAYKMIERDIKKLENDGLYIDPINQKNINYFKYGRQFSDEIKSCKCVDISAAYPNTLKVLGLIQENTYNYLMKLKKAQRLKAVGMLATRKTVYQIKNSKVQNIIINENPLANYFNLICFEVGELMNYLFNKYLDQSYLFWVDGIFCSNEIAQNIYDEIKIKYPCKIESVENLKYSKSGNYIKYKKDGKLKILPVPIKKEVHDEKIINFVENL